MDTSLSVSTRAVNSPAVLAMVGIAGIATMLALFYSAQGGIVLLAAAWIAVATWRYPRYAFFLLLFLAPILPILKATHVASVVTPLKDIVIVTLFVCTTVVPFFKKSDPYRRNALLLPLLAFGVWAALGVLRAESPVLGLLRFRDMLLYIPLLWVARSLMTSAHELRVLLRVLFGSAALTLLLVAVQFVAFPEGMVLRFDPEVKRWIPRASGTLAHPNLLASFLLFLSPLAASLSLVRSFSSQVRLGYAAIATVCAGALYLTYSRSGWIALAVSFLALLAIVVTKRTGVDARERDAGRLRAHWRTVAVVVAVLAGMLFSLASLPRSRSLLRTAIDPTYESNRERLDILAGLVAETSNTSALIGEGLGDVIGGARRSVTISLKDIAAADVREVQVAKARTFVDNAVLKTWVESGLVGLLLLGWIVWIVIRISWETSRRSMLSEGRALARAVFSVTLGLLALSFFLDVPEIFPVALLWWTLVGALQALPYIESASGAHP